MDLQGLSLFPPSLSVTTCLPCADPEGTRQKSQSHRLFLCIALIFFSQSNSLWRAVSFFFSPSFYRSLLKRFFFFFALPHCDLLCRPSKRKGTTKDCEGQRLLVPIRILPFSAIHENQKCFMLFMADSRGFFALKASAALSCLSLGSLWLCGFTAPVKLLVISQILALKWWLTQIRGQHWRLKHGTRCWQPLGWWAGSEVCSTLSANAIGVAVSRGGFCLKQ